MYQIHKGISFFTKFVSILDDNKEEGQGYDLPNVVNFPQTETYVGEDAAVKFLDYAKKVAEETYLKYIKKPRDGHE